MDPKQLEFQIQNLESLNDETKYNLDTRLLYGIFVSIQQLGQQLNDLKGQIGWMYDNRNTPSLQQDTDKLETKGDA